MECVDTTAAKQGEIHPKQLMQFGTKQTINILDLAILSKCENWRVFTCDSDLDGTIIQKIVKTDTSASSTSNANLFHVPTTYIAYEQGNTTIMANNIIDCESQLVTSDQKGSLIHSTFRLHRTTLHPRPNLDPSLNRYQVQMQPHIEITRRFILHQNAEFKSHFELMFPANHHSMTHAKNALREYHLDPLTRRRQLNVSTHVHPSWQTQDLITHLCCSLSFPRLQRVNKGFYTVQSTIRYSRLLSPQNVDA